MNGAGDALRRWQVGWIAGGGVLGALFGNQIGIAGFGGAIAGTLPCAAIGACLGCRLSRAVLQPATDAEPPLSPPKPGAGQAGDRARTKRPWPMLVILPSFGVALLLAGVVAAVAGFLAQGTVGTAGLPLAGAAFVLVLIPLFRFIHRRTPGHWR